MAPKKKWWARQKSVKTYYYPQSTCSFYSSRVGDNLTSPRHPCSISCSNDLSPFRLPKSFVLLPSAAVASSSQATVLSRWKARRKLLLSDPLPFQGVDGELREYFPEVPLVWGGALPKSTSCMGITPFFRWRSDFFGTASSSEATFVRQTSVKRGKAKSNIDCLVLASTLDH